MAKITFKEFLKKISAGIIKKSQQKYGFCHSCGEFELLKRTVIINGKKERCCNRKCIKRNLYSCRHLILGLWRVGLKPEKHKITSGYHKPYREDGFTEPETEPQIHRVSIECPLPLY